MENECHAPELARYVQLSPARAATVEAPEDYEEVPECNVY